MTQHDLRTDLDRGEAGERWLDRLLAPRYAIESLTPESRWFDGDGPPVTDYRRWAQTHGIDRVLVCRETGARLSVEVKTDYAAHRTGNMFFELTAPGGHPGWPFGTCAQVVAYVVVGLRKAYLVRTLALRDKADDWRRTCDRRTIRNRAAFGNPRTLTSGGLLVPLRRFEAIADDVLTERDPGHN